MCIGSQSLVRLTPFLFLVVMKEQTSFYEFRKSTLRYVMYGNGTASLLAFHGYGQDHSVFSRLPLAFPDHTIYAFDLFFHGKSEWRERERELTPALLRELIEGFIQQNKIERFSVLGFSIGARSVIASIPDFISVIDSVWLLAPHGIKPDYLYKLATQKGVVNRLFHAIVANPTVFFRALSFAASIGLVEQRLVRFVKSQMRSAADRQKVFDTWVVYSGLKYSWSEIIRIINTSSVQIHIVLGTADRIISPESITGKLYKIQNKEMLILNCGHEDLIEKMIDSLSA